MDIISHPNNSSLLALDINDNIKFVHLKSDYISNGVLTRDDYSLKTGSLPSLPQPVDSSMVKCMTWCSSDGQPTADALATGLISGRVVILWPGDQQIKNNPPYVKNEFIPHVGRACNALSWNEAQPNLLAAGMERSRSEHSLLVWDVSGENNIDASNQTPDRVKNYPADSQNSHTGRRSKTGNFTKPVTEACFAEAVNSITWMRHESKTLIAGISAKHLRQYDIRTIRSTGSAVNTKAVFGICQDPCFDMRLASFFDNHVHIWDLRNFTKPAAVITGRYNVVKVDWCPTRSGLLACLCSGVSEGRIIHAYDMTHATVTDSDSDIAYKHVEQIVKPDISNDETIGTFAWRNNDSGKNSLIAVTSTGTLYNVTVHERILLAWTNDSRLLSADEEFYMCSAFQNNTLDEDNEKLVGIDHIMYKRALNGYGLQDLPHYDPKINLEPQNKRLHDLWKWIEYIKEKGPVPSSQTNQVAIHNRIMNHRSAKGIFSKNPQVNHTFQNRFAGLQSELNQQDQSVCEFVDWIGVSSVKCTTFTSPQRENALKICGWSSIKETRKDNVKFKESLKKYKDPERAATIALWHLDMRSAIDILQQTAIEANKQSNYSVIAMALSGYSGPDASPLWREMCTTLQKSMLSPYLRASFAFLNQHENGQSNYKDILNAKEVSIQDRAAFACLYLPDDELMNVMEVLSETAAKEGDLDGVIVTGLITERGVELIQNYVDRTKDVQTAVLAIVQTKYKEVLSNPNVSHMLEGYRNLLNMWMLWKERAQLDIAVGGMNVGQRTKQTSPGVFVQCNFCAKSIRNTTEMLRLRGRGMLTMQTPGMMSKVMSCPSCRKPLPRCSVCCMCLGTSPTGSAENSYQHDSYEVDLASWFTWCPLCQHGGHAKHLTTWFQKHQDCPLSGCSCKCSNLIQTSDISSVVQNKTL